MPASIASMKFPHRTETAVGPEAEDADPLDARVAELEARVARLEAALQEEMPAGLPDNRELWRSLCTLSGEKEETEQPSAT